MPWKTGTLTVCWDFRRPWPVGRHVNRWGKMLRSARFYGGPLAVAVYRMDDRELVADRHAWDDGPGQT